MFSCVKETKKMNYYWDVPINRVDTLFYKNGSISRVMHFVSIDGLDGFWDAYSIHGEKGRTQLYLDGKVDTSWEWEGKNPVYYEYTKDHSGMIGYTHDSVNLKSYVQERASHYLNTK